MKIVLMFETEVDEFDIGTKNDAIIIAVQNLEKELRTADSTDDICNIFKVQIDPPFQGG